MKKSTFSAIELALSVPAFGTLVFGIFGLVPALIAAFCLLVVAMTIQFKQWTYERRHRAKAGANSLGDYLIARSIVLRAYKRGVIDRPAYLKGELFIERELNLNNLLVGVIRKGRALPLGIPISVN